MSEVFNAEQFEQTIIDHENQTHYIPVPEGDFESYVDDYQFHTFENKDSDEVTLVCDIHWIIPDEELAEKLGFEEIKVQQRVYIDRNPDGTLDFGPNKNVGLGRLRAALGLNKPGFQWSQLRGQWAIISVGQREASDGSGNIYNTVRKVAPKN